MSFQLKSDESLRKGLRRMMRKQVDGALELTGSRGKSRDEAVHEIRKSLKKVRALLRLVRPHIGSSTYRKANTSLRDAARPLTEVRDAKILIEVTDKLADQFKDKVTGHTFGEVREVLLSHARAVRRRVLKQQRAFSSVRKSLREARPHAKQWTDVPNQWSSIGDGLADIYRRASDAFASAAADPQVEKLHEWRKQAKYLRYQLEVLRPMWPERIEELAGEADRMGELLGDDHDLALLRQMLTGDEVRFRDAGDVELLLALIDHRRTQLQRDATLLGQRFFEEPPAEFVRRMKGYWRTWRAPRKSEESVELQTVPA